MQEQVKGADVDVEGQQQMQMHQQHGLIPLMKRIIIMHSSKLVVLAVFGAAMQSHGAVGWLLVCTLLKLHTA